ncbi:MAG: hypothetical protein COB35_05030 [Gammaproteobacteria bacterium]|nr:MAG: hypothetical protein COB35_05030 [Gammaproteobacteria bacterium]
MTAFNASEKQISAEIARLQQDEIALFDDCFALFNWFVEIDDLFLFDQGFCLGLDVKALQAEAQMSNRSIEKEDFRLLRQMGKAAAAALNEKRQGSQD